MFTLAEDRHSARQIDRFGRMRVEMTNISKANVCPYLGREIPGYQALGLDANKVYKLWRHPDELEKAAHTFDMVPILDEHVISSAKDPQKDIIAGTTGTGTTFEYPYLKVPMALWVGDSIEDVQTKRKRQLSPGYAYRPDMTPGVTPEGVAYDGIMRDIMGNHVTIVREGRTGPDVMVADENPFILALDTKHMKRATVIAALASFFKADADQTALDAALDAAIVPLETAAAEAAKAAALDAKKDADGDNDGDKGKPVGAKEHGEACDCGAKGCGKMAKDDKPALTQADVDAAVKLAVDSAIKTTRDAERALTAARADVAELVGDCAALDSAEAVYRYALKDQKVDGHETIHASALPAVWAQVKRGKVATTAALDSKGSTADLDAKAAVAAIGF